MVFFDDEDPFEDIIKEFFGQTNLSRRKNKEQFIRGEDEDRVIDFLEDDKKGYLIFELNGYEEKDVSVAVDGRELDINAMKSNEEGIQGYLHQKLRQGFSIKKKIPNFVNNKKFSSTMRNGVLEIVFEKINKS